MYQFPLGSLTLTLAAETSLPFDADAMVYEQDTALLLDTDFILPEPVESVDDLIAEAEDQEALPLGSILVQGDYPFEFFAIIHDVEQEPICDRTSIVDALFNLVEACEQRRLGSMAMPLLGTVFGPLSPAESTCLVKEVLRQVRPEYLNTVLIVLPHEGDIASVFDMLRAA